MSDADELARIKARLVNHATEDADPCQDRGCHWPCDVAIALGFAADPDEVSND